MAKVKAYKCDRCGTVEENMSTVTIREIGKGTDIRYYCENCLAHLYFNMQPIESLP